MRTSASYPALRLIASLLVLYPLAFRPDAYASTVEGNWRVRPDSREYCEELASRLATLPQARREPAQSLGIEGMRLCESGHVRTGVTKLRRAIHEAQAN